MRKNLNYDFSARLIEQETGLELFGEYTLPGRNYRWDYAVEELKIFIEIQGGTWSKGAHGRGTGINRDMQKLNFATVNGWRTLQYTPQQFNDVMTVSKDLKKCKTS